MKTNIRKIKRLKKENICVIDALGQACQWMLIYDKKFKNKTLTEPEVVHYQQLRDTWMHYPLPEDECF